MTTLSVLTREEWRQRYLRSYKIRVPGADTREGTQPWIDASAIADQLVVLGLDAQRIALGQTLDGKTGQELDDFGADLEITRPQPTGAIGYALMGAATSSTGTIPLYGDELLDVDSGMSYRFTGTGTYYAGDAFPIAGNSTGPGTNLEAGTLLRWSSPRAGCDPLATVQGQPDGTGLTGGRDVATDEEYRAVLREALSNPASAGNDAAYQQLAEDSIGHGVQVEKAFTYPGVFGPGTIAVAFVLKQSKTGGSRLPNSAQIAAVDGYIGERMPRDDSRFVCIVREQLRDIYLKIDWSGSASGWADLTPWPPYYASTAVAGSPGNVAISSVTDATHFVLQTANADYTGVAQPSAGQTIAVYDRDKGLFRRKKILTVSGTGPWTIVCDTASAASDTGYTPAVGQPVCPWSDSLALLVQPVADYMGMMGPGEQFASFYDEGARQRRNPRPPKSWPSVLTNRIEVGVFALSAVADAALAEGDGEATNVGTPGTTSWLQQLEYLAAYPKS